MIKLTNEDIDALARLRIKLRHKKRASIESLLGIGVCVLTILALAKEITILFYICLLVMVIWILVKNYVFDKEVKIYREQLIKENQENAEGK